MSNPKHKLDKKTVIGGAVIIGGAYLIIHLLTKAAMKKAAAEKEA